MMFIGVDVGASGAIAAVNEVGELQYAIKMPPTDNDIVVTFEALRDASGGRCRALLEKVHSSPQMGVASAFSFGGSYRAMRMALAAVRVPFDEVSPVMWQRQMGCMTGGDKNVTKQLAMHLFPTVKVTHQLADALILAECCRRRHQVAARRVG